MEAIRRMVANTLIISPFAKAKIHCHLESSKRPNLASFFQPSPLAKNYAYRAFQSVGQYFQPSLKRRISMITVRVVEMPRDEIFQPSHE